MLLIIKKKMLPMLSKIFKFVYFFVVKCLNCLSKFYVKIKGKNIKIYDKNFVLSIYRKVIDL